MGLCEDKKGPLQMVHPPIAGSSYVRKDGPTKGFIPAFRGYGIETAQLICLCKGNVTNDTFPPPTCLLGLTPPYPCEQGQASTSGVPSRTPPTGWGCSEDCWTDTSLLLG